MQLKEPIRNLLSQLQYVLEELTHEQFSLPVKVLSNASIGQHTRHILEFFIELRKGYTTGLVDYDRRQRDHSIETDRSMATEAIDRILENIVRPDREIILMVEYGNGESPAVQVTTSYYRELAYNMEHAVHHMALIRIGIEALTGLRLPAEFGIASSTLRFRKTCAQ